VNRERSPEPRNEIGPPPRSLRIAMLGSKGIPARHGGIERHVEELARRLVQRGHRVDVFTRAYHPVRTATCDGVRLLRRPSLQTKHFDAASHTALCAIESAVRGGYDILHFHGIGPGLFLPWAGKRASTVFTYHAQDWRQRKWGPAARWFLRQGERTAIRHAGAVIAVSHLLQRYVQDTYGRQAHYIPNGATFDIPDGDAALAQWGLRPEGYVLFVGRILADRGLGTLLDAFAALDGAHRLAVVGDVHVSPAALRALQARADPRVVFTGYQAGATLQSLYANAAVCVHPSEIEGLPIAVLEAMAHARPVVVSDIAENLEAIGDTGVAFPVGNPDALRHVLAELLTQPQRAAALGQKACARARASYNWEDIVRATEDVYRSLARARGDRGSRRP